jgi:predicted RNA-binding protein (virulence factor B family)
MMEIGRFNRLKVLKTVDFGVYLNGKELGEILLPKRYISTPLNEGDEVDAFIYTDSEDRLVATTQKPMAQEGDFAALQVVALTKVGAFMDWGLPKDLFIPFAEQQTAMQEGETHVVYVTIDPSSNRLYGSSRLDNFTYKADETCENGQEVHALVVKSTDLGFKCIVNNMFQGMLFANEVFRPLKTGDRLDCFIKAVREDGKLDLSLHPQGYTRIDPIAETLLREMRKRNGFLPLHDKSAPEEVYAILGISKKAFKQAVGNLYKQKIIALEDKGIRLLRKGT